MIRSMITFKVQAVRFYERLWHCRILRVQQLPFVHFFILRVFFGDSLTGMQQTPHGSNWLQNTSYLKGLCKDTCIVLNIKTITMITVILRYLWAILYEDFETFVSILFAQEPSFLLKLLYNNFPRVTLIECGKDYNAMTF